MAYLHYAGLAGIYFPHYSSALPGRDETMRAMPHAVLARFLDREADVALSHGRHGAAERLATRAAELRERAV